MFKKDGATLNELVPYFRITMIRYTDGMLSSDFCHVFVPSAQHFGVGSDHVIMNSFEQITSYYLLSPHVDFLRHINHNVTRARTAIEYSNNSEH